MSMFGGVATGERDEQAARASNVVTGRDSARTI